MRIVENRVRDQGLHEELLCIDPWGSVENGKFVGVIAFDGSFSEDEENVSVYHFDVHGLVDDFIDTFLTPGCRKFDEEDVVGATEILADLRKMVAKLEAALPDV